MPSKVTKRGAVTPEMNLTPLIDVTFQLIIFFMLVNNIISEETVTMIPPDLDDPKTREIGEMEKITVNLAPAEFGPDRYDSSDPYDHDGALAYIKIGSLQKYQPNDLAGVTEELRQAVAQNPKVEVLLRADGALFYEQVAPVMQAITAAGIEVVHVVTFLNEQNLGE